MVGPQSVNGGKGEGLEPSIWRGFQDSAVIEPARGQNHWDAVSHVQDAIMVKMPDKRSLSPALGCPPAQAFECGHGKVAGFVLGVRRAQATLNR